MEKRLCGKSGIAISVLGVGCWSFGGGSHDYWGAQDQRDVEAVVNAALDRGVNYFDTAEMYNSGRSEESLGKALKARRQEAVIGSKISPENTEPETLRRHCEASLRRLRTDVIDIYMVHWPITDHSVEDAFATLQDLQREGKIRAIGISNFGVQQMTETLATGVSLAVNQLCYNLLSRAIEVEILPFCREKEIGVVGYMPLQQGILTGKYRSAAEIPPVRMRTRQFRGDRPGARHGGPGAEEVVSEILAGLTALAVETGSTMGDLALAWAAARPGITCVLSGVRSVAQLEENIRGVSLKLSPEVLARMDKLTEPLLRFLGKNADYFESDANSRIH